MMRLDAPLPEADRSRSEGCRGDPDHSDRSADNSSARINDTTRTAAVVSPSLDSPADNPPVRTIRLQLRPALPLRAPAAKIAGVIGMLSRAEGATIDELVTATGWLPHTTRAALTGLRKRGYALTSDRSDRTRGSIYRIVAAPTSVDVALRSVRGRRGSAPPRKEAQNRVDDCLAQAQPLGHAPASSRRSARGAVRWRARGQGKARAAHLRRPGYRPDDRIEVVRLITSLPNLDKSQLLLCWRNHLGGTAPAHLPSWLLARVLAFRLQAHGVRRCERRNALRKVQRAAGTGQRFRRPRLRQPGARDARRRRPEARRDARSRMARQARTGHGARGRLCLERQDLWQPVAGRQGDHRDKLERPSLLWPAIGSLRSASQSVAVEPLRMRRATRCPLSVRRRRHEAAATRKATLRCAIYTRVSSDSGLEQEFNSLDAQREASEAYIKSQAHEGWKLIRDRYDDGGFSGGSMERPALQKLLEDVREGPDRRHRRLQGRSPDPLARRLRQARRTVRRARRLVRLGHPGLQHDDQHGEA